MTQHEKANQLILFYSSLVDFTDNNFNTCRKSTIKRARLCALRTVNEIIKSYDPINEQEASEFSHDNLTCHFLIYWNGVKDELLNKKQWN